MLRNVALHVTSSRQKANLGDKKLNEGVALATTRNTNLDGRERIISGRKRIGICGRVL